MFNARIYETAGERGARFYGIFNGRQWNRGKWTLRLSRFRAMARPLPGGRKIVSAVARRMEIKLALFVRSPSGPTTDHSLLSFAWINGERDHMAEDNLTIVRKS